MTKETKIRILSILCILNVIFIPTFEVWGGLFPDETEYSFFSVISSVFSDSDALGEFGVLFKLLLFIPSIIMLISSFFKSKTAHIVSSGIGVFSTIYLLIKFVLQSEISALFDFSEGNISIGTWIAFILFIISFLISLFSEKE